MQRSEVRGMQKHRCWLISMLFNYFIPKAHRKARGYDHLRQYFFGRIKLMLQEVLRETCNFFSWLPTEQQATTEFNDDVQASFSTQI